PRLLHEVVGSPSRRRAGHARGANLVSRSTHTSDVIMPKNLVAKASVVIDAPAAAVWDALVDSSALKEYMFGSTVISDWKKGSKIVFKGEWQGKPYEDKGVI